MSAEREQKQLDAATENLLGRLNDVRGSLTSLIAKLETDPLLNWHSFLDSQALISGQLNSLMKSVKMERTPMLKRYTTLPLLLSADRDEELLRLTESRVPSFNHDLVPHYLRTKPEPEVEAKYKLFEQRANTLNVESLVKQYNVLEKITRETLKVINREREDLETKANARNDVEKTHSVDDTMSLLSCINYGKLLRQTPAAPPSSVHPGGPPPRGGGVPQQAMAKAPSIIKTNIKAATQVHPYRH